MVCPVFVETFGIFRYCKTLFLRPPSHWILLASTSPSLPLLWLLWSYSKICITSCYELCWTMVLRLKYIANTSTFIHTIVYTYCTCYLWVVFCISFINEWQSWQQILSTINVFSHLLSKCYFYISTKKFLHLVCSYQYVHEQNIFHTLLCLYSNVDGMGRAARFIEHRTNAERRACCIHEWYAFALCIQGLCIVHVCICKYI